MFLNKFGLNLLVIYEAIIIREQGLLISVLVVSSLVPVHMHLIYIPDCKEKESHQTETKRIIWIKVSVSGFAFMYVVCSSLTQNPHSLGAHIDPCGSRAEKLLSLSVRVVQICNVHRSRSNVPSELDLTGGSEACISTLFISTHKLYISLQDRHLDSPSKLEEIKIPSNGCELMNSWSSQNDGKIHQLALLVSCRVSQLPTHFMLPSFWVWCPCQSIAFFRREWRCRYLPDSEFWLGWTSTYSISRFYDIYIQPTEKFEGFLVTSAANSYWE